jgi:hypothetical protein
MKNKFVSPLLFVLLLFTLIPVAMRLGAVEANTPDTMPILKVEPQITKARINGSIIQINVTINDLKATNKIVGVQFRLCFNSTLLEFINATEGPFLPYWASKQPGSSGTWFQYTYDPSHPTYGPSVMIGDLILPNSTSQWNPPFPEGNGTIATLNFNITYQQPYLNRRSAKLPSCELALVETKILDTENQEISHTVQDGSYTIWPRHNPDLDLDGKVDLSDVLIMSAAFGAYPTCPRWDPICDISMPEDSMIDLGDVLIVYLAYGWVRNPDP